MRQNLTAPFTEGRLLSKFYKKMKIGSSLSVIFPRIRALEKLTGNNKNFGNQGNEFFSDSYLIMKMRQLTLTGFWRGPLRPVPGP